MELEHGQNQAQLSGGGRTFAGVDIYSEESCFQTVSLVTGTRRPSLPLQFYIH